MKPLKQIQISTPTGSITFCHREDSVDETVVYRIFSVQDYCLTGLGLYPQIDAFLANNVAQGLRPLILDIGANIGASAVYFYHSFPNARVIAVEPDSENFELLSLNSRGIDCVPMKGAIASEKGFVRICDPGLGPWGFRTEVDDTGEVEAFTIPELLFRFADKGFFPFIVKIDIEGAEAELFSKNTGWIDTFPILIIELHDWMLPGTQNSRNFLQCIAGRNRDFLYVRDNVYSIRTPLVENLPAFSPVGAPIVDAGA